MSHPRRSASRIALDILEAIDDGGEATKWDIIKVVGNTQQFRHWIEDFLLPKGVLEERIESDRYFYYRKTQRGELFHSLLKSGNMVELMLRVSGKRLRRQ